MRKRIAAAIIIGTFLVPVAVLTYYAWPITLFLGVLVGWLVSFMWACDNA